MVRRKSPGRQFVSWRRSTDGRSGTHILVDRNIRNRRKSHVLHDIQILRKSTNLLIPRVPFVRLVREILADLFPNSNVTRIQASALEALQEAAESYLVQFFEDCVLLSLHAKRVTLFIQDMILMRRLRGRTDVINR